MAAPCSISEAIKVLDERQKQKQKQKQLPAPVDVMGIVVNYSIIQSPPVASSLSSPKAEIWITDPSVSSGVSARVTLHGSTEVARVADEKLAVGDVVRFNRLSLNKNHSRDSFQFLHSWSDPEPGFGWFRLGHIASDGTWISQAATRRIPDNMTTSEIRISELTRWFQGGNTPHSTSLSPLPCTRRSLSEIQSCVGLLSHVAVRVTHFDCQVAPQSPVVGKRKRSSPMKQSLIGYATVSDDSGVFMSLVDPGSRFGSTLRTALDTGKYLMLTNLSSRNQNDIHGRPFALEEVVLLPTRSTTAVVLSNHKLIGNGEASSSPDATQTQVVNSRKSQVTLVSSLLDISIGAVSLRSRYLELPTPATLLATILTTAGEYSSATLHLESTSSISIGQPENVFYAGSKVVMSLCGGVEARELMGDEALSQHASQLVRSILDEGILLRWTIDARNEKAEIVDVVLPKL
jgi:hypothetical protein